MSKIPSFVEKILRIDPEERKIKALERIADALDRLAPPPLKVVARTPIESTLIETTDEDLCRMEDQEREKEQERLNRQIEARAGKKSEPAS